MKRVFAMMLFLMMALVSYAGNQVKGELRTEINGFQWYCNQGKEAYTLGGQSIFGHLKSIRSITFSAADKNDKGFFVIKYKGPRYKRTGAFDPYTYKEIYGVNDDGEPCNIYSIALTFSNPNHTEYYVRADKKSKLSGPTFNNSDLFYTNGNEREQTFNSFSIKGNFIIFTWDNFSYVTRFDGKEITKRYGQIVFQESANHFICKGSDSYYQKNDITIIDALGNTIIKGIKSANYNKGFIEIENDRGRGILSYLGKWIVSPEKGYSDYLSLITNNKTFCKVKYRYSSRYHLLTSNGDDVLGKDFDEIDILGGNYIKVKNSGSYGIVTFDGKEIIPTSRGYTSISNYNSAKGTFSFTKRGVKGVCNIQGKEISTTRLAPTADDIKANGGYGSAVAMNNGSTKYYKVSKGERYGLTDSEGREIIPCEMEALESAGSGYLKYKLNGFWGVMNYTGKIIIPTTRGYTSIGNYISFTKRFAYTMNGYKGECNHLGQQVSKIKVASPKQNTSVASSLNSSSSSSSTKNNNSGNKTTTVVVEQHGPVQVWVACGGCQLSPGRCSYCNGSGWGYNNRLCSRCNGTGKCTICNGTGGHNEVQYR